MPYSIRKANRNDILRLGELLEAYMQETYQGAWGGTREKLGQHLADGRVEIIVAETVEREVVAFIAWIASYDLHWCMKGGEVIDFFVSRTHRGRGAAILLVAEVAAGIKETGGSYLKGGAVNPAVRRLYERIAMCLPGGESYISGRAFRRLAELSGKSLREVIKNLPDVAWNYEP